MSSRSSLKNGGGVSIPAASRKMVQNLKEIVNCPEHEIYAMLKECNMDPNDTVHKLLSQDTFHEVKSKKEKKKETKDPDSRSRLGNTSNRGSRGALDRNSARSVSSQFSSTDSGALRGKPAYRKENGTNAYHGSSTSSSGMLANNVSRHPAYSDAVGVESKAPPIFSGDTISSSSQPTPAYQSAWAGVPGHVSMADIVKMGKPKASTRPTVATEISYSKPSAVAPNTSYYSGKDSFTSEWDEPSNVASQHATHDDWPVSEQSGPSELPILEPPVDHEVYNGPSLVPNLHAERDDLHLSSQSDDFRIAKGDANVENLNMEPGPGPSRRSEDDSAEGVSHFDNDSFDNTHSYQSHRHAFDHAEETDDKSQVSKPNYSASSVDDVHVVVSSVAANLQQLNLWKEEQVGQPAEDNPSVKIPDHLQIPTADCLHLSFGSFGSGSGASYPGQVASKSHENSLEDASAEADVASVAHSEARNPEYYGEEQFRSTSDGYVAPRSAIPGSYELPSSSQPEAMKQDATEATHGHNYTFATSVTGYGFENIEPNSSFSYAHANQMQNPATPQMQNPATPQMQNLATPQMQNLGNPQMQNITPFSSAMHVYSNSLLASTGQGVRESDVPYPPFHATQSMPTKYSNSVSSISGPTISMPETLKPGVFSTTHLTQQNLPGSSISTGPTLPQHLTVHSYSQPTLPLGPFANMVGYPFLHPTSYYMPSAFQQAYGGNTTYHQSPDAVHGAGMKYTLPQLKNVVPSSSFPPAAAIPSGHRGFAGSANLPGNFSLNPSATPASSTTGYDDVINSHYKDNSHLLQQNDNSGVWVHGPTGSRTVSAIPASTYYSLQGQGQGQGQQHSGFRQGQQQQQQHYGNLGYPNFYHSQTGVSQEHQQQQAQNDGSQGQQSKQSHQLWQHSY